MTDPITAAAWLGTGLQLVGAFILAGHPSRRRIRVCYGTMLPGAGLLLEVAFLRHDWPQAVLMGAFVAINAFGLYRWRK